jgi:hypothetical protein
MHIVWAMGTIHLKPGVLRLFEWSRDFNMNQKKNTHAQVWIRLMALPHEYWMERTLQEITSVVGTPLVIDNAMSKTIHDHYARILVDMDFSKKLFYEILVEREGFSLLVEVVYEWLPNFCTHYQNLGHDVIGCRCMYPRKESQVAQETIVKGKAQVQSKKQAWVSLKDNHSGVGSSMAFAVPAEKHSNVAPPKDMAGNSSSFALQNVMDEIPQGVLPHSDMPVLELVTVDAHDDVHLCEGEGTMLVTTGANVS